MAEGEKAKEIRRGSMQEEATVAQPPPPPGAPPRFNIVLLPPGARGPKCTKSLEQLKQIGLKVHINDLLEEAPEQMLVQATNGEAGCGGTVVRVRALLRWGGAGERTCRKC